MTSSLPTSVRTFDFDGDPAPSRKVNATEVDAQLDSLHAWNNQAKAVIDGLVRSDNQLKDFSIREWMLHPEIFANFGSGGNTVNIYPGGGSTSSGGIGYNVKGSDFGAIGDGTSHPLTLEEATVFNSLFESYGAQGANAIVAGDERDWAAIQCALWKAAVTGSPIYLPLGIYVTNKPLGLSWTATPIAGQPERPAITLLYGDGPSSRIYAKNIATGRGALEFLGESNGHAVNLKIANLAIEQDATCHQYSWCLRIGDGWAGINLDRVFCYGANGIRLKVASSVSYANLCTQITQCVVWTNWQSRWHASETTADVFALAPESGGSYWDNVKFLSCIFQGHVDVRAFALNFDNCLFFVPSNRPDPANRSVTIYLGTASFYGCYFEDHYVAISTGAVTAPISSITIRDCHFTGINNIPPGFPHRAIQCAADVHQHGPVTIENCRFGPGYTYSHIDLYGPITVAVLRCSAPFNAPINTGPIITKTANVRLVLWNPNGVNLEDTIEHTNVRLKVPKMTGPTDITQDVNGPAENVDSNTNGGASAYAARVVSANGFTGKLAAFGPGHALANQLWLYTITDHPVVVGVNGAEQSRFSAVGQRIEGPGLSGEYGLNVRNPSTNAAASTALRVYQNQNKGLAFITFGQFNALSGQSWIITATSDPMIFGVAGVESVRIGSDNIFRQRNLAWIGGPIFSQTANQPIGNTTTESSIVGTGVGVVSIPANELIVGRTLRLKMRGFLSSTATPTLRMRAKLGGVTVADTTAVTQVGTPTNVEWELDVELVVRSVGAGGTAFAQGRFTYGGTTVPLSSTVTVAVNTTISNLVDITAQWGTANVGNVITSTQFVLEVV